MHPVLTALIKEGHPLEVICKRADISPLRARQGRLKPLEIDRLYAYAALVGVDIDVEE